MPNTDPRKKVTLTVEVYLDPVPGVFHTPESARLVVQTVLDRSIDHYEPSVKLTN